MLWISIFSPIMEMLSCSKCLLYLDECLLKSSRRWVVCCTRDMAFS